MRSYGKTVHVCLHLSIGDRAMGSCQCIDGFIRSSEHISLFIGPCVYVCICIRFVKWMQGEKLLAQKMESKPAPPPPSSPHKPQVKTCPQAGEIRRRQEEEGAVINCIVEFEARSLEHLFFNPYTHTNISWSPCSALLSTSIIIIMVLLGSFSQRLIAQA